jgi:hypothetical protein
MVLLVGLLLAWQLLRKTRCINSRFVAPPPDTLTRVQMRKMRRGWTASLHGWLVPRGEPMFLANIAEGRHKHGAFTRLPAVEIPKNATTGGRAYFLASNTGTVGQATLAGVGSIPIGVWNDSTDRGSFGGNIFTDLTIPLAIHLFGSTDETELVSINSNVALGDLLTCDANGYAKTLPATAGINYVFGRALQAGAAGDNIEFDPILPKPGSAFVPLYAGVMASTVASEADVLAIAGLLNTDLIVVTLNTQHAAETIVTAQAAAGQINVTLSAAASIGNTKYNVAVFRALTQ